MECLGRSELLLTKIQQGNWNEVQDELSIHLKALTSISLRSCADFVLKFLHTAAVNLSSNLKNVDEKVFESIFTCYNTAIAAKADVVINEDLLIKSLYYIMENYLKVNHQLALKLSSMLYKELLGGDDDYKEKGSKSMPKSYIAIFRNSYLILWNRAASIERDTSQNSNPLDSLFLRLEALKYSYWVVTDFVKFFDQANKAIRVYCQKIKNTHCITLDTVCEELFLLMGQLLDDSVYTDSITNYLEVFKGSFSFLLSWVSHLLNMDMVTKAEEVTEKFKLKICKFLMTKLACNSSVMEYCVDILLLAVYFHPCVLSEGCSEKNSRRTIVLDHCCSFRQPILDMSDCLSRCFTVLLEQFIRLSSWVMIENNDLMELHLFIPNLSKLLENFITAEIFRSKEKSARAQSSHEHKFYNYCSFYTHLLAISTASLGRYSKLESSQSNTVSVILSDAMEVSKRYMDLLNKSHDRSSSIKYYVSSLWNLATICYSNGWYADVHRILTPCVEIWKELLEMKNATLQKDKLNILNKIRIWAISLTRIGLHKDALYTIANFLTIDALDSSELLEIWVKVKLEANSSDVKNLTTLDILSRRIPESSKYNLALLLKQEYMIYQRYNRSTTAEMLAIVLQILDLKLDNEDRAEFLLECAKLQLCKVHDFERTPMKCCQEAIKLLETEGESKQSTLRKKDCLLAHAYFVFHLLETQANQVASTHVLESDVQSRVRKEENEDCDVNEKNETTPAYGHITLEMEYNSMHYLDKSLNIWTTIATNPRDIYNVSLALIDLKTMAEMYSVSRMISHEIQARKLCLEIAKFFNNILEWGYAVARLVHAYAVNGLSNESAILLNQFKLHYNVDDSSSITPSAKTGLDMALTLADSELLLMQGKIVEGWKCLQEAFPKFSSIKGRNSLLMYIEAKLLASKFCELPSTVLPRDLVANIESPITLAIYSLQTCMNEVKSVLNTTENQTFAMDYKPRLINLLLDSALRVGQLFHDIGAPREARCYLQEKLIWAQKLALANRTAELLLVLARVDVLCNENSECLTKLAGVKYIIESAGRKLSLSDHEKSKTSNESSPINCVEPIQSDDEFQIITPVNSVKPFAYWSPSSPEKSPTLSFKTSFNNWQSHSGNCIKCKHVMFYHLRLELAFLQIEYDYLMTESWESVKDSFSELLKYVKMWKGVVEALFLHKFNAKKKRPKTSGQKTDEPLLQFDLLTCRILCKMAYMQMQCNYLAEAHETIKNAYFKIKNLPWIGLSHCYHLKSLAIYFFCLIKLLLMTKADSLSFSDFLDKIWSTQKLPHLEPECSEIDFLTAKVDNVVLSDKVVDSFKTPRVVNIKSAKGKTRCQCTKLSSKKVCDFQTCSLCTPSMCHAPIKKFSALSSYENAFSEYELEVNVNKSRKGRRKKPLETESKANFSGDDSIQEDECEIVYIDPAINNENHLQNSKHKKSKKTSVIQCCPQNETALKELTLQYNTEECKETVVMTNNKKGKDSVRRTNSKSSSCDGAEVETMNRLRSSSRQKTKKDVELARANNDSEGFLESRKLRRSLRVVEMGASTNRRNEDVITPLSADSIKNSTKTQMGSKVRADAKSSEDSFLNESFSEIEVLRCESSPEVIRISERKVRENNDALKSHSNKALPLQKIIALLEKALSLICHHPHMPLYSDLNVILALLKGDCNPSVIYHLLESVAGTIRHMGNMVLEGKIKSLKNECLSNEVLKLIERKSRLAFHDDPKKMVEQLSDVSKKINKDWTICQINTIPSFMNGNSKQNLDLIVTRLQPNCRPVTIRISSDFQVGVENFISEFDNILSDSRTNVRVTIANKWWEIRSSLDCRLKNLLASIENNWLRHWKGLLLGRPVHNDDEQKLNQATSKVMEYLSTMGFTDVDESLLKVVIDSIPWFQASQLRRALSAILRLSFRDSKLGEITMTVQCHSKYICSEMIPRHPVILILDKKIQQLPWESIPILRNNPVTRMPSVHFLLGHLTLYNGEEISFDTSDAFYVLNPSNNLPDTEKTFKDYFNSLRWPGLTGKSPTKEEWAQSLSAKDLFVYCGHGTGNQFINSDVVQRNECKSCTILMGCSSGKLKTRGQLLEPDGVPLQYLVAGCPSFVGNLWDVTDKDIDRYLMALLKRWLPGPSHTDSHLCNNVAAAREACKFTYLVGSAPVTYGLPVKSKIIIGK